MGPTTIGNEELRPFYEGATLHVRSYDSINNDARPGPYSWHCMSERATPRHLP
jgi:hypothetical protein